METEYSTVPCAPDIRVASDVSTGIHVSPILLHVVSCFVYVYESGRSLFPRELRLNFGSFDVRVAQIFTLGSMEIH
jgi:hypothetical protein